MKKIITWTSLILAVSLFAESGDNKGQLKRSMKVVPMDPKYLSTENGGINHASVVLSDGVGIYTTQEDEYAKTISYLNSKYGDDSLKNEQSLKEYILDNGTVEDKELANKLNLATVQKSNPGDSCDDGNPQTENDIYLDENFTCQGKKIYYDNKCYGDPIGSEFEFEGKTYLVVDNNTIKANLNRAETLCTSNVTDMYELLANVSLYDEEAAVESLDPNIYNANISNWDTSNVTNMSRMFAYNEIFNQDISNWDVSNVINMHGMFERAYNFNQSLNWDTRNVEDMSNMFLLAKSFNGNLNFNTSKVIDISNMFNYAYSFNKPLNWNTSNVEYMVATFDSAILFNQPLNWNTNNVLNMNSMFNAAQNFNQPIGNWDTSNVTNMSFLFNGSAFNQDISTWDVSKVEDMSFMFYETVFNQDISNWNVSNLLDSHAMFGYSQFNGNLNNWNVSKVTDMSSMFSNSNYNNNLSNWNVSNVTNMRSMFYNATKFNQNLNTWCVPNISTIPKNFKTGALSIIEPKWGVNCP